MNILLIGPQGSGKGTQARLIKEKYSMSSFDMGAFLREEAKSNPEIKSLIEKGSLLSDDVINSLVSGYLSEKNLYDGIIFDGYPRRVGQLTALQSFLKEHGSKLDCTVYINIPEQETLKRLSARRINSETGEIYNLITNPPSKDVDIEKLIHRADDKPEAIKKRLDEYRKDTEPLIAELKATDTYFVEIDGTQSIESIHREIIRSLANYEANSTKNS